MVDRIVIRRWKDSPSNPIALFMDQPERNGTINSYQMLGQHGAADPGIIRETQHVPIDDPDGIALVRELRAIGYDPLVMVRFQRS